MFVSVAQTAVLPYDPCSRHKEYQCQQTGYYQRHLCLMVLLSDAFLIALADLVQDSHLA